jgi:hypothetical protein
MKDESSEKAHICDKSMSLVHLHALTVREILNAEILE